MEHFDRENEYIEILKEWSPDPRDLERLLHKFSPADLMLLLDVVGSPKEANLFLTNAKKLVAEMLWREEMKAKISRWAKAMILVGAVVGILNSFALWVLMKWPK